MWLNHLYFYAKNQHCCLVFLFRPQKMTLIGRGYFFVFRTDDRSILVDLFRSSSNSFRLFLSPFVRKSFNVSAKIRYTGKCQTNSLKYNRLNESDSSFYVKSIYVLCKAVSTLFQSINQYNKFLTKLNLFSLYQNCYNVKWLNKF